MVDDIVFPMLVLLDMVVDVFFGKFAWASATGLIVDVEAAPRQQISNDYMHHPDGGVWHVLHDTFGLVGDEPSISCTEYPPTAISK